MSDSVSREAVINVIRDCSVKEVTPAYLLIDKKEVLGAIMMLPKVTESVIIARWEPASDFHSSCIMCSNCKTEWLWTKKNDYKFCPNCGAKMKGEYDY